MQALQGTVKKIIYIEKVLYGGFRPFLRGLGEGKSIGSNVLKTIRNKHKNHKWLKNKLLRGNLFAEAGFWPIHNNPDTISGMTKTTIAVRGEPAGEPRPRAGRVMRTGKGKLRAGIYVPDTADEWKRAVRRAAKDVVLADPSFPAKAFPGGTPVQVDAVFIMPRPKSHYGTGRNSAKVKPSAPAFPVSTPDFDNIIKATVDALGAWPNKRLSKPLLWRDDSQIVVVGKMAFIYECEQRAPGVKIEFSEVVESPPWVDGFLGNCLLK